MPFQSPLVIALLVWIPTGVAAAPLATDDQYGVSVNGTLTLDAPGVLSNDSLSWGGTRTTTLGTDVTNGVLTLSPYGSFTYTPAPGFVGTDTFTYQVTDD